MQGHASIVRQIFLYSTRITLAVSVGMALAALTFVVIATFFGQSSAHPIYWLAFPSSIDETLVSLLCVSILFIWAAFAVLAILSFLFSALKPYAHSGAKAVMATLIAIALMFLGHFISFFQYGPLAHWETVESINLNGHTYHVLLYVSDESWNKYYYLYECDRFDLFCSKLKSIPQSNGGITPSVEKIRLIGDEASNTVTIEVNGAIAFTHRTN
jgi:hypothetical protein